MTPKDHELHEDLLAHEAFLHRLARRLVTDEARADDLVQDTWAAALASPPAHDGALRAWLGTIARRLAIRSARAGDRRRTRERRAARPERIEGEAGSVDRRLDAQALLIDGLRKLPEPQRVALSLRYADDLDPRAIAARLDVPVDTVKARLRRGLAALRAELDAKHGGERGVWAVALLPELGRGAGAGGALIGEGLVGKGLMMATVWKLAAPAALVLAVAGGLWATRKGAAPETQIARAGGAQGTELERVTPLAHPELPTERAPVQVREPDTGARTPDLEPQPVLTEASSPWQLRLTLEGNFREPAAALIRPHSDGVGWPEDVLVRETFDAPGTKTIDVGSLFEGVGTPGRPTPRDLLVSVSSGDCAPAKVHVALERSGGGIPTPPPAPLQATVRLDPGAVFEGRLVAHDSAPLGAAAVLVFRREGEGVRETVLTSVVPDGEGRFRFVLAEGGPHVVVGLTPERRPTTLHVDARVGTFADLGEVEVTAGEEVAGIMLRDGAPAGAGYRVGLSQQPSLRTFFALDPLWLLDSMLTFDAGRIEWGWRRVETDEAGRFRFRGLAPRDYSVFCNDTPDTRITLAGNAPQETVRATARGIELAFGWSTVELRLGVPTTRAGMASLTVHRDKWAPHTVSCGGEGETFSVPPDEDLAVTVEVDGFAPERVEFRTPAAGGHLVVPVTLRPGVDPATLVVQLEGPLPPQGTTFYVHDLNRDVLRVQWSGRPPLQSDSKAVRVEQKDGELTIEPIAPGAHHFLIYAANATDRRSTMHLDMELECSLSAGETRRERLQLVTGGALRLDVRDARGGRAPARCELVGRDGPIPLGFIASDEKGSTFGGWSLSERAVNDVSPNLPAGRYQLKLTLAGHATLEREVLIRAGELTLVDEQLREE